MWFSYFKWHFIVNNKPAWNLMMWKRMNFPKPIMVKDWSKHKIVGYFKR
jgi:hypothetical protein